MIPTSEPNEEKMKDMSSKEILIQKRVEMEMARTLLDGVRKKYNDLIGSIDTASAKEESKFRLEPHEEKVLRKLNNSGLREGVAAGLLTLFALRRLRANFLRPLLQRAEQPPFTPPRNQSPMEQMIQQQRHNQIPNSPFQNMSTAAAGGMFHQQPEQRKESTLFRAVGWILDLMMSGSTMIMVSWFAMDLDRFVQDVAKIPLAPGYSTLSREFCPVAIEWLQQLEREAQKGDHTITQILQSPIAPITQVYLDSARNCQLRLRYEAKLRADKGVKDPNYRVEIPASGVPTHMESLDDSASLPSTEWDNGEQMSLMENDFRDENESSNRSWADDLVQGQDHDSR